MAGLLERGGRIRRAAPGGGGQPPDGQTPYYHTFTHKSNAPSIALAERLIGYTHGRMSGAFFTNSGSEANDTVIKFVWYYNNALGRPLKKSSSRGSAAITA